MQGDAVDRLEAVFPGAMMATWAQMMRSVATLAQFGRSC